MSKSLAAAERTTGRSGRDVVRLTADLPRQDAARLADLTKRTGFNKVTNLVRAIRVLDLLVDAEGRGSDIQIVHKDGTRERLVIT